MPGLLDVVEMNGSKWSVVSICRTTPQTYGLTNSDDQIAIYVPEADLKVIHENKLGVDGRRLRAFGELPT